MKTIEKRCYTNLMCNQNNTLSGNNNTTKNLIQRKYNTFPLKIQRQLKQKIAKRIFYTNQVIHYLVHCPTDGQCIIRNHTKLYNTIRIHANRNTHLLNKYYYIRHS